jgi:phosphoglucosamine mutase
MEWSVVDGGTAPRKLFGTDGVRGVAGEFLSAELATALGRAAAAISPAEAPQVLIVRDTRESGEMLEAALAAGVAAGGGHALLGGVLPTPGASLLVRRYGFDLAAVVSASHNPYQDNGIKFFGPEGTKLDDAQEAEIERLLGEPAAQRLGRVRELHGAPADYLRELEARFADLRLDGINVLLDCANGATHRVAPEIFRRLGAHVDAVAVEPDGRNINEDCGSTHVEGLAAHLDGHDLGFAFDGDGDRVLAIDRNGAVIDGDELLAVAALHLREHDRLPGNGVAVTVMTNYGFHQAMREHGVGGGAPGGGGRARTGATATSSRSCSSAAGHSAASSRATSSTPASCPPATAPRRPSWCSRRSPGATSPSATRWRSCPSDSSTSGSPIPRLWTTPRRCGRRSIPPVSVSKGVDGY